MVDDLLSTRIGYATRTALEILPKERSDFATPMIQSTITKSLKNVVLAKSSSQPQSTYKAAASLTDFEIKKILIDKLEKSKSYRAAIEHRNLYDALIQSYQLDKDLFDSYGLAFNLLKGTFKSFVELEYHFEECYKAVTDQLDWNNPKCHEYPFDLSKPLLLIEAQGHQVVPADYLFNNDLEYLKVRSSSRKYTTSTTKTKAARYDNIEGIEDMVPEL
ncbi:hypothetical protein Tco_1383170 [Tanacetum coccineum]